MPGYTPAPVPENTEALRSFLFDELARISEAIDALNPQSVRLQRWTDADEPPRPRDGDIFYFPTVGGSFDPGASFGLYWHDSVRWRLIAGLDETVSLGGTADDVTITAIDFEPVVNYAEGIGTPGMSFDQVAGTITLPAIAGLISITTFLTLNQITTERDFTVLATLGVGGVSSAPLGSAYVPQQSSDVDLTISSTRTFPVSGGEVLSILLQLDNQATADFEITTTTFEVTYQVIG